MILDALFGAAVRLRNSLYDSGRLRAQRLQGPVISVGNISIGGAGKTPFVIALGELLKQRGVRFDVLSRGYRRASKGILEVDAAGSPADFGDEPLLIARRLNIPVVVGESRYDAGRWSEEEYGPRLHLLDDGFQHRRLARDFDIVVLTAQDLHDRLLPAGRLREPLASLGRANAIVIDDAINAAEVPLRPEQALWRIRRGIEILPPRTPDSSAVNLSSQSTNVARQSALPFLAFCAIARPRRFFDDLKALRIKTAAELPFPDHHRYSDRDVADILAAATKSNASGFITTEKDLVNLGPLAARLQPLHIARLIVELLDSETALAQLLNRKSTIENRK